MDNKERNTILSAYIKAALIIFLLLIIVGIFMLFKTTDTNRLYATAFCSISAILNCIGLTLLLRRKSTGVFLIVIPSLISAVVLSITCAEWLGAYFGSIGFFIPYIIICQYLLGLFLLLLVKSRGKTAWQQMTAGVDYTHFRHIYQLSSVIIVVIIIITIFVSRKTEVYIDKEDEISDVIKDVPAERLDAADVTIEEIVSFEKQYNESIAVNNRDQNVIKRIFALKHLLLSGLMPEIHNRENLVNICVVHAGEFSPEQQEILDWYLALDISIQEEWNVCEKATSIKEFKSIIDERIK